MYRFTRRLLRARPRASTLTPSFHQLSTSTTPASSAPPPSPPNPDAPLSDAPLSDSDTHALFSDPPPPTTAVPTDVAEATVELLLDPTTSPAFWPLTDNAIFLVQNVHEVGGLPWFAAIAGTTLLMRTLLVPLAVHSMKNAAKLAKVQPEMAKVQERMKNARGDEAKQAHAQEMRDFMGKHGVNPLMTILPIVAQMPIFMSFFFGLQRMATDYPSLVDGGALWFQDLTVADPTYGLPLLASATFLITIELGGEAGQQQPEGQAKTMKNVMRCMAVGMVPLTMSMPASVFMYWITSNAFSCLQTAAFKFPAVKNALGIPIVVPAAAAAVPTATSIPNFSTNMENVQPPPPMQPPPSLGGGSTPVGVVADPESPVRTKVKRRQKQRRQKRSKKKR